MAGERRAPITPGSRVKSVKVVERRKVILSPQVLHFYSGLAQEDKNAIFAHICEELRVNPADSGFPIPPLEAHNWKKLNVSNVGRFTLYYTYTDSELHIVTLDASKSHP